MSNRNEYIKIEKHIPMPETRIYGVSKYEFLKELEIGDSFTVDVNTIGFNPKEALSSCYTFSSKLRKMDGEFKNYRISTRVLSGTGKRPRSVRIWRIS